MSTPRPTVVPPMPTQPPPTPAESVQQRVQQRAAQRQQSSAEQVRAYSRHQAEQPVGPTQPTRADRARARARQERTVQRSRSTHRERTKNRTFNININKGGPSQVGATGATGGAAGGEQAGTPGAGFMSNEDIRTFSEHVRKQARNRAVERSLDHEHLVQVLRHIPDSNGSRAGSRARARRVARHLRAIASAEKIIARSAAGLYRAFEAEFESELAKVGKARPKGQAAPRQPFKFG